jgi:hypothetical protein
MRSLIIALVPLASERSDFGPLARLRYLRRNLLIYGLGGIIVPFIGIKLIDLMGQGFSIGLDHETGATGWNGIGGCCDIPSMGSHRLVPYEHEKSGIFAETVLGYADRS